MATGHTLRYAKNSCASNSNWKSNAGVGGDVISFQYPSFPIMSMFGLQVKVMPVLTRRFMPTNRTQYLLGLHSTDLLLDMFRCEIIYFSMSKKNRLQGTVVRKFSLWTGLIVQLRE